MLDIVMLFSPQNRGEEKKKKELFLHFLPAANCCCRLPPQFLFFMYRKVNIQVTVLIRQSSGRVKITISHPLPFRNVCLETSKVSQLPSECGTPRKKSAKKSKKDEGMEKNDYYSTFFLFSSRIFFLGRHSMPYKDDIHFAVDAGGRDTMAADNFPREREKFFLWGGGIV